MVVKSIIITTFITITIIIIIIIIIINWNEIVFNLMIFFESKLRLFNRKNECPILFSAPLPTVYFAPTSLKTITRSLNR